MSSDVSLASKMHLEIQKKSGHLFWARYRPRSEVIDIQELFNDYWSSKKDAFVIPS